MQQRWRDRLDGGAGAGWAMLPLRLFLGFAFVYAGLSKIADRDFLDDDAPTSMHQTLIAVRGTSPIGSLLGPVEAHSALFGTIIAIGEVAIGLGVLAGLLTRIAALGGMVLAAGLWLTISWGADPWYTGADIVYVFAFTPLLIAGAGALSADAWLAGVSAAQAQAADSQPGADRTRRALLAGALGLTGLIALGAAALTRGAKDPAPTAGAPTPTPTPAATGGGTGSTSASPTTPTSAAPPTTSAAPAPTGAVLAATSQVPVGGGARVDDDGEETWVLQLQAGEFTAVRAACPHQGCAVNFVASSKQFVCPCHNSVFAGDGARISGVATTGLEPVAVVAAAGQVHRA